MNIKELLSPKGDKFIWGIVIALSLFSILVIYSATKALAFRSSMTTELFAIRHAVFIIIGLVTMFIAHKIDYNYYSAFAKYMLYAIVPILVLTLFFGVEGRWLNIPFTETTFQPSELAKFILIMYLARVISKNQATIKSFKEGLLPILIPVLIVTALIIPSDFSTAILILITSFIMMIVGRINYKYILAMMFIGITSISLFFGWLLNAPDSLMFGRTKVWKNRLAAYKSNMLSEDKRSAMTFQERHAFIAIANGGILGQGPGKSHQKNFLPEAYSDYVFAIIAEEYGFWGAMLIVCLYLFFFWRCVLIFIKSPGTFGGLLAVSLALSLVIQALMNIMVTVGLLPVTGVTLPLVSWGGTSIIMTCLAIGIILSVDHYYWINRDTINKKPKSKNQKKDAEPIVEEPKVDKPAPEKKLGGLNLGRI